MFTSVVWLLINVYTHSLLLLLAFIEFCSSSYIYTGHKKEKGVVDKKVVVDLGTYMLSICFPWKLSNNNNNNNNVKKMRGKSVPLKAILGLCVACFVAGTLFTTRTRPCESSVHQLIPQHHQHLDKFDGESCDDHKRVRIDIYIYMFLGYINELRTL